MELPFHSPTKEEEWCRYECSRCGKKDEVPAFIVGEFAMGEDLKKGELPEVACPRCDYGMKYKYTYKKKISNG
jgi:DNA-directed RNA polymerase subunit RPC12/RpoP